jgi:hypothetical protein
VKRVAAGHAERLDDLPDWLRCLGERGRQSTEEPLDAAHVALNLDLYATRRIPHGATQTEVNGKFKNGGSDASALHGSC